MKNLIISTKKVFVVSVLASAVLAGCYETGGNYKELANQEGENNAGTVQEETGLTDEVIGAAAELVVDAVADKVVPTDSELTEESISDTANTVIDAAKKIVKSDSSEQFSGYKRIEVDACNLSGHRETNVVVDIGMGDREYFAFTNEHGQLVKVVADKIILQDDRTESVTSSGRYCNDEAKVPGVESKNLDEGHVIADSMGGVSNAYNITAQNSTLNRHGDQAYMEDAIRKAGGATNFEAIITYPNTDTQIPSSYQYTYTIKGRVIVDKFENVNPDEVNKSLGLTGKKHSNSTSSSINDDISSIDTDGNGQVTIKEAKAAGFKMPISSTHWLYKYMDDRDNDGLVGE